MAEEDEKKRVNDDGIIFNEWETAITIKDVRVLQIIVKHVKNKKMYCGTYSSSDLVQSGFSSKQAENLENVKRFMECAQRGDQELQF